MVDINIDHKNWFLLFFAGWKSPMKKNYVDVACTWRVWTENRGHVCTYLWVVWVSLQIRVAPLNITPMNFKSKTSKGIVFWIIATPFDWITRDQGNSLSSMVSYVIVLSLMPKDDVCTSSFGGFPLFLCLKGAQNETNKSESESEDSLGVKFFTKRELENQRKWSDQCLLLRNVSVQLVSGDNSDDDFVPTEREVQKSAFLNSIRNILDHREKLGGHWDHGQNDCRSELWVCVVFCIIMHEFTWKRITFEDTLIILIKR
jgi:hypothetical protein